MYNCQLQTRCDLCGRSGKSLAGPLIRIVVHPPGAGDRCQRAQQNQRRRRQGPDEARPLDVVSEDRPRWFIDREVEDRGFTDRGLIAPDPWFFGPRTYVGPIPGSSDAGSPSHALSARNLVRHLRPGVAPTRSVPFGIPLGPRLSDSFSPTMRLTIPVTASPFLRRLLEFFRIQMRASSFRCVWRAHDCGRYRIRDLGSFPPQSCDWRTDSIVVPAADRRSAMMRCRETP